MAKRRTNITPPVLSPPIQGNPAQDNINPPPINSNMDEEEKRIEQERKDAEERARIEDEQRVKREAEEKTKAEEEEKLKEAEAERKRLEDEQRVTKKVPVKKVTLPIVSETQAIDYVRERYVVPDDVKTVYVVADGNVFYKRNPAVTHSKDSGKTLFIIKWD